MTAAEVEDVAAGRINRSLVEKLNGWRERFGGMSGKQVAEFLHAQMSGDRRPLAEIKPHWQIALDKKFEAVAFIKQRMDAAKADPNANGTARRLIELGFGRDIKAMIAAQAYSFNAETIAAIREASKSIPHDAPLSSIETPNTGAGWFWFAQPIALDNGDAVQALLWAWETEPMVKVRVDVDRDTTEATGPTHGPSINFTTFVAGGKRVMPSTRWVWPFEMSFADMVEYNRALYRRDYGSKNEDVRTGLDSMLVGNVSIADEAETMRVVHDMALFFAMSCVWFRQTVPGSNKPAKPKLERTDGEIGRQNRKRLAKEHNLVDAKGELVLPRVQVVALRKSERTTVGDAPEERQAGARNYGCRWIVQGHPRMQVCGPGRKDRKLIWIDAHVAGPEDKPLRTKEKVYAVVR
jgi:hypothetical protein